MVESRSHRKMRSCSLCQFSALNRRLFKVGDNGRYVCIDAKRCAGRQEMMAE